MDAGNRRRFSGKFWLLREHRMWRDPAERASLSALSKHPSDFGMCDVAMSRAEAPRSGDLPRRCILRLLDLRLSIYLDLVFCAYIASAVAGIAQLANTRSTQDCQAAFHILVK